MVLFFAMKMYTLDVLLNFPYTLDVNMFCHLKFYVST